LNDICRTRGKRQKPGIKSMES